MAAPIQEISGLLGRRCDSIKGSVLTQWGELYEIGQTTVTLSFETGAKLKVINQTQDDLLSAVWE